MNAVEAWHQEGLRLIARETDDRMRTLLRSNLAALVEALPRRRWRRRGACPRAPAAGRAPAAPPQTPRRGGAGASTSASRHALAAPPPPSRERRRCRRSDAPRTARERADLRRARLPRDLPVRRRHDRHLRAGVALHAARGAGRRRPPLPRPRGRILRLDVKCVFDARAFSCGPGGPELRLAADAPADVLTLLAAPPDDAYVVAYLKEELIYDRLGLAAGEDVLDAVPRLGGEASASDAVEAVGTTRVVGRCRR